MSLLLRYAARGSGRNAFQTLQCLLQSEALLRLGVPVSLESGQTALRRTQGYQLSPLRGFSEELRVVASALSEGDYHHMADETLEGMVEKLEAYVEDNDVDGGDVEYSQGVLTVKLGKHGTFVVNKQTPNRQIWLSSPVSGPFRFDHIEGRWLYHRDRRDLLLQLEQEISALVGAPLHLQ
ncbi:hypothetical protein Agub_g3826 [Astrephomene gubernaculifera]|uniref:ferroxidase n=1 Tax=Astrephomene gubernaculifera TaxID=47775 RepID=A0AAD3DJD9_9CHLO|nr:hypothetical protein Agub_g3826 [Astrephomene gubernaculifera]